MIHRLNTGISTQGLACDVPTMPSQPNRYSRNEKDDLKTAIDALYEFKRKLDELHPNCIDLIHSMLQQHKFN